jgi:hypothetical protein
VAEVSFNAFLPVDVWVPCNYMARRFVWYEWGTTFMSTVTADMLSKQSMTVDET